MQSQKSAGSKFSNGYCQISQLLSVFWTSKARTSAFSTENSYQSSLPVQIPLHLLVGPDWKYPEIFNLFSIVSKRTFVLLGLLFASNMELNPLKSNIAMKNGQCPVWPTIFPSRFFSGKDRWSCFLEWSRSERIWIATRKSGMNIISGSPGDQRRSQTSQIYWITVLLEDFQLIPGASR